MTGLNLGQQFRTNLLCRKADRIFRAEKDKEKAGHPLNLALDIGSSDERTYLAKARMEFDSGNYDETLKILKKGEKIERGKNPAPFLLKGQALYEKKEYTQARIAFEKVLELDGRNGMAKNFLAFCYLQENRIDQFRTLLAEEGLWHRPDLLRIAWTQRKLPLWDLHQKAKPKEGKKKDLPPLDSSFSPKARIAYARKAVRQGRADIAFQALSPLVEERRKDSSFVDFYVEVSIRAGNVEKALEFLQQRLRKSKDRKGPKDAYFFFLLGQCYFVQGDIEASVDAYRQGEPFTTMPYYSAMLEYYIALSWLKGGKFKPAGEAIEKACRMDPLLGSLIAASLTALLCRGEPLINLIEE